LLKVETIGDTGEYEDDYTNYVDVEAVKTPNY